MLKTTLSMSVRLACKAVGLARSMYRRLQLARPQPIRTPNVGLAARLRDQTSLQRVPASLGGDERREVNKKKDSLALARRGSASGVAQPAQAGRHLFGTAGNRQMHRR
jgi:hypothetical protein